jgi:hypothetical protein
MTLSEYLQSRVAAPPPEGAMHPGHPRWQEFYEKLGGPGYVNFRNENGQTRWDCKAGRDKSHAIRLLSEMGFSTQQIVETCVYFEDHGGMCDCEILWNVAPRAPRRVRTRQNPSRKAKPDVAEPALPPQGGLPQDKHCDTCGTNHVRMPYSEELTGTVNSETPNSRKGEGSAE